MRSTRTVHHTSKFTAPAVAGLRVLGKDRVYMFRDVCGPGGALDIGRTNKRSIRIRDDSVSIKHCIVRPTSDGEYEIFDLQSKNGVRVCDRPGLRRYRPVQYCKLEVGLFIKLGRVYLVAVGEDGKVPLLAYRQSEFGRLGMRVYGTVKALIRKLGLTRHKAQQYKKQLEAMNKAASEEDER